MDPSKKKKKNPTTHLSYLRIYLLIFPIRMYTYAYAWKIYHMHMDIVYMPIHNFPLKHSFILNYYT